MCLNLRLSVIWEAFELRRCRRSFWRSYIWKAGVALHYHHCITVGVRQEAVGLLRNHPVFFLSVKLPQWKCEQRLTILYNRISVGAEAVWRLLQLQGVFVFGALRSLLRDSDKDTDWRCRSGFDEGNISTTHGTVWAGSCVHWIFVCFRFVKRLLFWLRYEEKRSDHFETIYKMLLTTFPDSQMMSSDG